MGVTFSVVAIKAFLSGGILGVHTYINFIKVSKVFSYELIVDTVKG